MKLIFKYTTYQIDLSRKSLNKLITIEEIEKIIKEFTRFPHSQYT